MSSEAWEPGAFAAMVQDKANNKPRRVSIAGWIKHPFALDFRVFIDEDDGYHRGWRITHIPSGYAVRDLECDFDRAVEIADFILSLGDWSVVTRKTARSMTAHIATVKERYGADILNGRFDVALGPIWRVSAALAKAGGEDA